MHETGRRIVKCRGCGADIIFVVTQKDKHMPVDVKPIRAVVLAEDGIHIKEIIAAYVPHHSTCPDADKFRGPQAQTAKA